MHELVVASNGISFVPNFMAAASKVKRGDTQNHIHHVSPISFRIK